jgi:biopolymer transport protein ExbB/TolQ
VSVETVALRTAPIALENLDYGPLLRWLILNGLALFGLFVAWYLGLIQLMLQSDRSYISLVILLLYIVMTAHSFLEAVRVSWEMNAARRAADQVRSADGILAQVGDRLVTRDRFPLPPCLMTQHFFDLLTKARLQGHEKLDQTILLQSLAEHLKGRHRIGWFMANTLLKLGLLGTVIGFILMLSPISSIDAYDVEGMKAALTTMSAGMAVALFTTLAGLVGGILLTLQYYMLDDAAGRLFALITEISEVYIVSAIEKGHGPAL